MKKVSIIIPVYNTENYLEQCLNSVLSQTMRPDEIILIDDGSTDESAIMCEKYAKKDSCVKVIHKKNEGLGIARNTGIEAATSEYIMFLDSDDYLKEDMIEKLYSATRDGEVDLVKSGLIRVDLSGNPYADRSYDKEYMYVGDEIKRDLLPKMLGSVPNGHDSFEMGVTCSLLRLSIVRKQNCRFPSEREFISEDLVFNMEFIPLINSAVVLPYSGYYYRTNPNSLTVKFRIDRFEACKKLYSFTINKINELALGQEAILRWKKTFLIYIRMCIRQEKGINYTESKGRIEAICRDAITRELLNTYPISELGIKQKVFIFMVKYKLSYLLWRLHQ